MGLGKSGVCRCKKKMGRVVGFYGEAGRFQGSWLLWEMGLYRAQSQGPGVNLVAVII